MSDSLFNKDSMTQQDEQSPIYSQRDLWYFRTHDGKEIGPFRYRSEAETGLHRLLGDSKSKHRALA